MAVDSQIIRFPIWEVQSPSDRRIHPVTLQRIAEASSLLVLRDSPLASIRRRVTVFFIMCVIYPLLDFVLKSGHADIVNL
jgi:hypothetical protein